MVTLLEPETASIVTQPQSSPFSTQPEGSHSLTKIKVQDLNFYYGPTQALYNIHLEIPDFRVTALIGPSGCGKSTFLRTLNRMNDIIPGTRATGNVLLHDQNIYAPEVDVVALRKRVGMVFQKSNPFPKSIFENVAYGCRIHGTADKSLSEIVETSLTQAGLWNEVKDRLHQSAMSLSGGQQQRLCIARALAVGPEVLLMDEPTSALDPRATAVVEELVIQLRKHYTIVIVTHNMQQATRISNFTGFFYEGRLVEFGPTTQVFETPQNPQTEAYISGHFG